jgi:hypothetical protein
MNKHPAASKPETTNEFRMNAAEFDAAMRGAMSVPAPKKAKPAPKPPKKAAPPKRK